MSPSFHSAGASRVDVAILITCLALGAVLAVPRQARIAADARRAEVAALGRSADSAAGLAHALWQAQGMPGVLPGIRGAIAMVNGYPSGATLPLMLTESEASDFVYADGAWQHRDVPADRPCRVAYAPPLAPDQPPVIRTQATGC